MKAKFLKLLLLLTLSLSSYNSFSSHFAGGNIYYDCIGPNLFKFWFEYTLDCATASNSSGTNITITGTNTCGLPNVSFVVTLINTTGQNVSQVCVDDSLNTKCTGSGNTIPGRIKFLYSGTSTIPPCNTWTFGYGTCCRNAAIVNLSGAGSSSNYYKTTMSSRNDSCNNSVRYSGVQNPYVCIGNEASYNFGAYDPDGDSLSYRLIAAPTSATANAGYNTPYSGTYPINAILLDSTNGTITFTPNTLGSFVVVVEVTEYDSAGNIVGTTMRDIQIVVYNCQGNFPPNVDTTALYNVVGQGSITGKKSMEVCAGDVFCVDFKVYDTNALDTLKISSSNLNSVLPGATLTYTGVNPITATLCWTVPSNSSSGLKSIVLNADDGYCPIPGQSSFSISIDVITNTTVSPDVTICLGDSTKLLANGGAKFNWYSISGPPLSVGTNIDCDTCNPVFAKPTTTTIYEVVSDLSGGCNNKDTVQVTVASNFGYTLNQNSTGGCRMNPIKFEITPDSVDTYTYKWTPPNMLSADNVSDPTLTPTQSGTFSYEITTTNSQGCVKKDTVQVYISNGTTPNTIALTDKDTVACNQVANLSSWVDTAGAKSDYVDNFDSPLSPLAFLNIYGGTVGTGCGANSAPNSLNFNGGAKREIRTKSLKVANCTQIEYAIRLGNSASGSGCASVGSSDPIYFQYSANGGTSWVTLGNHNYLGWITNTGWQSFNFNMPTGVTNAIFRWHQPNHGGSGQDNWALDDIKITCSSLNNYAYSWTPAASLGTPNQPTTTASPRVTTNYQLIVTDTTGGCSDTSFVELVAFTDYPSIDISTNITNGCKPIQVIFTNNTDPTKIGTVTWDFGDGNQISTLANPVSHTYRVEGKYTVSVTITSPNGCVSDTTYTDLIEVYDKPVADFAANPQPTNVSNPNISFYDQSSNFVNYWYWNFGNINGTSSFSTDQNPSYLFPSTTSGTYPVTLIVSSEHGCIDTVTKNIIIDGLYTLYLPSSFTPNGDGLNDEFGPNGEKIDAEGYKFLIFNRWGEVVFSSSDVNEKWNGRKGNSGDLVLEGSYTWKINSKDGNTGEEHENFGHVIVLNKTAPK